MIGMPDAGLGAGSLGEDLNAVHDRDGDVL